MVVDCGTCWFCGKESSVEVDDAMLGHDILDWREHRFERPHIQDAFPQLTPGMRETILNGSHEACFDAAFPEEEE